MVVGGAGRTNEQTNKRTNERGVTPVRGVRGVRGKQKGVVRLARVYK